MFYIDRDAPLTNDYLTKALMQFNTRDAGRMKHLKDYYNGKHAILLKQPTDSGKPNEKAVVNFCYENVEAMVGMLTGQPVTYSSDNDIQEILEVLDYNDEKAENTDWIRMCCIAGYAPEILYIDRDGKIRFKCIEPTSGFPVYSADLDEEMLYFVRFYSLSKLDEQTEEYIVEVYTPNEIKRYKASAGFVTVQLLESVPHHFSQVPVVAMKMNRDMTSSFEQIISLVDCYNSALSSELSDWQSFCDTYLQITGCQADENDLKAMKEHRVLMLDEGCDAKYLTKDVNDAQIQNILQNLKDQIHAIGCTPDFSSDDFANGAQSGISIRYKLLGFENKAAQFESEIKRALQKRIELICSILHLTNVEDRNPESDSNEEIWRDITITVQRNLPVNLEETANVVNQLRGIVSNETLLTQIPFVKNPEEELKKVNKEKEESMELYGFDSNTDNENEDKSELLSNKDNKNGGEDK